MSEDQVQETEIADDGADPEVERKARDMGWVSAKEWRGSPPKNGFASAEEFLRRGEEVIPVIRSQLKKKDEQLAALQAKVDKSDREHADTIRRIERMSKVALDNQRTQIESQYQARKEAAVEVGDKAAYQQIVKDEKEAIKALDDRLEEPKEEKAEREKTAQQFPKDVQDTLDSWQADNRWYESDEEMQSLANVHHRKLLKDKPGLTLKENLEEVRKYVKKRFPEAFAAAEENELNEVEDEKPKRGSAVEGGSRMLGGGGRSLFSKLPAEAKAAADRFIKEEGLFLEKGETPEKDLSKARERYAAQFLGDDK